MNGEHKRPFYSVLILFHIYLCTYFYTNVCILPSWMIQNLRNNFSNFSVNSWILHPCPTMHSAKFKPTKVQGHIFQILWGMPQANFWSPGELFKFYGIVLYQLRRTKFLNFEFWEFWTALKSANCNILKIGQKLIICTLIEPSKTRQGYICIIFYF